MLGRATTIFGLDAGVKPDATWTFVGLVIFVVAPPTGFETLRVSVVLQVLLPRAIVQFEPVKVPVGLNVVHVGGFVAPFAQGVNVVHVGGLFAPFAHGVKVVHVGGLFAPFAQGGNTLHAGGFVAPFAQAGNVLHVGGLLAPFAQGLNVVHVGGLFAPFAQDA